MTIFVVIMVFSVLILVHEAGHMFAAKRAGVNVEIFSLGFGKRLCGVEIGGTDYRISLFPLGGYVKMEGEEPGEAKGSETGLYSKPVGYRFWIMASGALTNYVFAFVLFWAIFMIGVPMPSNEVGEVIKDYPAEKAGIRTGDVIVKIDGKKVGYWDDIVDAIRTGSKSRETLTFDLLRDDEPLSIDVTPEISTVTNVFGQKISRPMIGIGHRDKILPVSYGPAEAFYQGGRKLLSLTAMTYKGLWLMITGGMPLKESVSGPIGIMYLMNQAARLGVVWLLIITAQVSMALAIFNLLPFPVLDGGHIMFLAAEKIMGRPVSVKVQEILTNAALILLIAFALFVSWQDVIKFRLLGGR
ncbi:MAG: RIP metalloprotease RseP [Candidatus Omnitrophota bacterium]